MEGLLPCWFPRRSLMPWRPRRGCCRGGSRGGAACRGGRGRRKYKDAAAASDHAAFGRRHTRRQHRSRARCKARQAPACPARRHEPSDANPSGRMIQNPASHPIGIARRSDFWATWPAAPVPPRPDCYNRCRRGLTISCVSTFRFWYNFLEKKRFWYNLYM